MMVTYIVPLQDEQIKIKGIGRFSPTEILKSTKDGERVTIGQKVLTRVEVGLPEYVKV